MLDDEQQRLVLDNYRLIGFTLNKYFSGGSNLPLSGDELWQHCALALCEAAMDYNPAEGQFSTFAVFRIRHAILYYSRSLQQDKRKANNHTVSFDAICDLDEDSHKSAAAKRVLIDGAMPVDERVCLSTVFETCARQCPTQAPYFNACLLKRMKNKDAAKAIGVSGPTFRERFNRYKIALANALE